MTFPSFCLMLPIERSNCSCSGATCQKPGRNAWHSHGNSPRKIIACCSQTGEPNILRPQILSCQPHKVELLSSIKPERAVPEYLRLVVSPILRLPNIFAAGDFLCSFLLRHRLVVGAYDWPTTPKPTALSPATQGPKCFTMFHCFTQSPKALRSLQPEALKPVTFDLCSARGKKPVTHSPKPVKPQP